MWLATSPRTLPLAAVISWLTNFTCCLFFPPSRATAQKNYYTCTTFGLLPHFEVTSFGLFCGRDRCSFLLSGRCRLAAFGGLLAGFFPLFEQLACDVRGESPLPGDGMHLCTHVVVYRHFVPFGQVERTREDEEPVFPGPAKPGRVPPALDGSAAPHTPDGGGMDAAARSTARMPSLSGRTSKGQGRPAE